MSSPVTMSSPVPRRCARATRLLPLLLALLLPLLLPLLLASASTAAAATPAAPAAAGTETANHSPTMTDILANAPATAWRPLNDEHTLYLELPGGRVVMELLPALAPRTVANIEALARLHYYDGLAVLRVQDNFVAQWGDADAQRPIPDNLQKLTPEFSVPLGAAAFTALPDADGYAAQVGFVDSFPAARDPATGQAWLTHCYGAVGVGRDNDPSSGNGSELYVVIGHAPRQLDRNVTVVGRVRRGIELLATLPRGGAELGFYEHPSQRVPIASLHLAVEWPQLQRTALEVLRTDSASFNTLVAARRNRRDAWYVHTAGYIDLCNVPLPVRPRPTQP